MTRIVEGRWFVFKAKGHVNVRALHKTTFEVTKEDYLTPRGDCIIGISSEVAAADLPNWLKDWLKFGKPVVIVVSSGGFMDSIIGWGDPRMTLNDPVRMVFRKSNYVGPETVVVRANKAARDLDRRLVEALRRGEELIVAIAPLNFDVYSINEPLR